MSAECGVLEFPRTVCGLRLFCRPGGPQKNEGPGTFLERTPGLLHCRRAKRVCIAFMPGMHGAVQSHRGTCIRVPEESYRLYNCACCGRQVRICRHCDRGNRYCAWGCAAVRAGTRRGSVVGALGKLTK